MSAIYHQGELFIQKKKGVLEDAKKLEGMVKENISYIAKKFLENLNLTVVTLSVDNLLYSFVAYDLESFIEVKNDRTIHIKLNHTSKIPKLFLSKTHLTIGLIGIDFQTSRRIRINGYGKEKNGVLEVITKEVYSNCPKNITKRVLNRSLKKLDEIYIKRDEILVEETIETIKNSDTFFISSLNDIKGADVSHKGGEKGFVKVLDEKTLEYDDFNGNNLFNTLGNIKTNKNINLIFIDFKEGKVIHINGFAKIKYIESSEKTNFKIEITCNFIATNYNSFLLDYKLENKEN